MGARNLSGNRVLWHIYRVYAVLSATRARTMYPALVLTFAIIYLPLFVFLVGILSGDNISTRWIAPAIIGPGSVHP